MIDINTPDEAMASCLRSAAMTAYAFTSSLRWDDSGEPESWPLLFTEHGRKLLIAWYEKNSPDHEALTELRACEAA